MAWDALFYEAPNGRKPVARYLRDLSKQARSKCSKYIEMLEKHGLGLPSSYLEKVRGDIWALRPEYCGNEFRIFFFDAGKNRFVITHIIHKTTRRIDQVDIDTAQRRMEDWVSRHKTEKNK
jgi:phage-related protein